MIGSAVRSGPYPPRNQDELAQALIREWNAIDNLTIQRLIYSCAVGVLQWFKPTEEALVIDFDDNKEYLPWIVIWSFMIFNLDWKANSLLRRWKFGLTWKITSLGLICVTFEKPITFLIQVLQPEKLTENNC